MFMGGVDCTDQNIDNYGVGIQSKKWCWPVLLFCLAAVPEIRPPQTLPDGLPKLPAAHRKHVPS